MRLGKLWVTLLISLTPLAAEGAVRYEFQQTTRTEPSRENNKVVVGSVYLDRGMSRVDYAKESTVGAGTWVIARNGGRDTIYVDPASRTYLSRTRGDLAETISGVQLQVSNLKIDRQNLGSGPVIAGYPTDHHRLTATYDVSISLGPVPLVQHVSTVIDKWTTPAFGDAGSEFFRGGAPRTGNAEIDRLIEAETLEVPGFPLRQVTTITTEVSEKNLPRSSQIQIDRSRRQVTEMTVTRIGRAESDPSLFQIPSGYRPIDAAALAAGPGNFQNLTPSPVEQN